MKFRVERVETVLSECFVEAPDLETVDDIIDKGNLKFEETNQTSDVYVEPLITEQLLVIDELLEDK